MIVVLLFWKSVFYADLFTEDIWLVRSNFIVMFLNE